MREPSSDDLLRGTHVPPEEYGKVLGELRAVTRSTHERSVETLTRMASLEERMAAFVDPVTRRARMGLIFAGSAFGGLIAGGIVELVVRLLAHELVKAVALLGALPPGG